ncbi:MAG: putative hydrolase of the superfamily [Solirubrobacteraceae bacterium]|jgi:putative hydrolase of the HAD superfamily|nr:putative hydrolase of the superfamily [Solirubrobacteraceae bacterium]
MVITLDALGTLVELQPPAPLLAAALRRHGARCSEEQAAQAIAAEIAYYRANHDSARDELSLARLRARCTQVLKQGLQLAGAPDAPGLAPGELQEALLSSLRFAPYPEVAGALSALRGAGHRLVVVSNWDVSLHAMLRSTGLEALVDGAISSAEAGVAKPGAAIFRQALALAGGGAGAALHAGDSVEHDVAGALAAGLAAVLVVRRGPAPALPTGVRAIRSLAELAGLAA